MYIYIIYYYIKIICIVNKQSCVLLTNLEHDKLSKVNRTIKKYLCIVWKYTETDLFIIGNKKRQI